MKLLNKDIHINTYKYGILFALLLPLCWLFPYTGDDWMWGSSMGEELWEAFFDGYSGRYFGNIIVLILTRYRFLRAIVVSGVLSSILFFIDRTVHAKNTFALSTILLALTPRKIFRQAIVWTAGFSNYSTSVLISLVLISCAAADFTDENGRKENNVVGAVAFLILGFAGALIVEHITIFNLMLSFGLFCLTLLLKKVFRWRYLSFFAGSVAGAAWMFSNSVYHKISEGEDFYRSYADNGLVSRVCDNYLGSVYPDGFFNNFWINIALLITASLVMINIRRENIARTRIMKLMEALLAIFGSFTALSLIVCSVESHNELPASYDIACGVAAFIGITSILIFSILSGLVFGDLFRTAMISLSIIVVMAPLLIVQPVGPRCYFASYVFFIVLECLLADYASRGIEQQVIPERTILAASVALYITFLAIFLTVNAANERNLDNIRAAADDGQKTAVFEALPFESYLWRSSPFIEWWALRYRKFYGLPDDMKIIVTERQEEEDKYY